MKKIESNKIKKIIKEKFVEEIIVKEEKNIRIDIYLANKKEV